MRLGLQPRKDRLSASLRVAMICALVSLVSGCMGEGVSSSMSLFESTPQGSARSVTMFVASTRRDDRRVGDAVGDGGLHHALIMVSVPSDHQPGVIEAPTFGKPNIKRHFALTNARAMTPERFTSELGSHISGRVGGDRDILLYVHGFNTSLDEARLLRRPSPVAIDVEVAIGTDPRAVGPVDVDSQRRRGCDHQRACFSFSKARARWLIASFSAGSSSPKVRASPCGTKIGS